MKKTAAVVSALFACFSLSTLGSAAASTGGPDASLDGTTNRPPLTSTSAGEPVGVDYVPSPVPVAVHAQLSRLTQSHLGSNINSFTWDSESRQIQIVHTGSRQAIERRLGRSSGGVNFSFATADYSIGQLTAEARRLARAPLANSDVQVSFAAPKADGSGLEVGLIEAPQEQAQRSARNSEPDSVTSSLANAEVESAFPVDVVEAPPVEEAAGRREDTAPFKGGAWIARVDTSTTNYSCSSGFGILQNANPTGIRRSYMLTADHCGANGSTYFVGNVRTNTVMGQNVGQMKSPTGTYDAQRLESRPVGTAPTINHAPFIYLGKPDSTTGAKVRGYVNPVVNDLYCHSGSRSGTVCNNIVVRTNISQCRGFLGTNCYDGLVETFQRTGIAAVGSGDSGGPSAVLVQRTDGKTDVYAAGIISAVSVASTDVAPCTGDTGRTCSKRVYTTSIDAIFRNVAGWGILYTTSP